MKTPSKKLTVKPTHEPTTEKEPDEGGSEEEVWAQVVRPLVLLR